MNQIFKTSILEMVILLIISKQDIYGYDITQQVYDLLCIKEGISYPTLRRLVNEGFIEAYEKNDAKKFYHLTNNGIIQLKKQLNDYNLITNSINLFKEGFVSYE